MNEINDSSHMLPEGIALTYYSDLFGYDIDAQYPKNFKIHSREVNLCTLHLDEVNKVLYLGSGIKYCIIYIMPRRSALILVLTSIKDVAFYAQKFENLVKKITSPIGIENAQQFVEDFYTELINYKEEIMNMKHEIVYKIIIVGDPQVGKTSLLYRYEKKFPIIEPITLGAQIRSFYYFIYHRFLIINLPHRIYVVFIF